MILNIFILSAVKVLLVFCDSDEFIFLLFLLLLLLVHSAEEILEPESLDILNILFNFLFSLIFTELKSI